MPENLPGGQDNATKGNKSTKTSKASPFLLTLFPSWETTTVVFLRCLEFPPPSDRGFFVESVSLQTLPYTL